MATGCSRRATAQGPARSPARGTTRGSGRRRRSDSPASASASSARAPPASSSSRASPRRPSTYRLPAHANYSVPARNRPLDPAEEAEARPTTPLSAGGARSRLRRPLHPDCPAKPALDRRARSAGAASRSAGSAAASGLLVAFADLSSSAEANETAADFVREKIRETVHDPATAERLCPAATRSAPSACVDTGYFETYNRDNVDARRRLRESPIAAHDRRGGLRRRRRSTSSTRSCFATGFDAMTGALLAIDVRGREGGSLRDKWADGPRPTSGWRSRASPTSSRSRPGQPLGAQQHGRLDRAARRLDRALHRRSARPRAAAHRGRPGGRGRWVDARRPGGRDDALPRAAWYSGANIPGKPRVFMPYVGGVGPYRASATGRGDGYEGFELEPPAHPGRSGGATSRAAPSGGRVVDVVDPAAEERIGQAQLAGAEDMGPCSPAARAALGPWWAASPDERARCWRGRPS